VPPRALPLFKGPTSKGIEGNGRGERKVKGKEGERWREGFGPPKNFGVAPPMSHSTVIVPITVLCYSCIDLDLGSTCIQVDALGHNSTPF